MIEIHVDHWDRPSGIPWDIYLDCGYVRTFAEYEGAGKATCFTYRKGDRLWAYPFVQLPIEDGLSEISTAYGYGGMTWSGNDPEWFREGRKAFEEWAKNQKIVTEFIRWHPFLPLPPETGDLKFIADRITVSIRLDGNLDEWRAARPISFRSQLRQAMDAGLEFREAEWEQGISKFHELYTETMKRQNATEYYFFDLQHFHSLRERLGNGVRLVSVSKSDGEVLSMAMMLLGGKWAHYHLSASNDEGRRLRSNNLLLSGIAGWCKERGAERVHLGGGSTAEPTNSLLKFKRNLATDEHVFYLGKQIHLRDAYERLCDRAVSLNPELAKLRGTYLQLFRHPSLKEPKGN